MENKQTLDVFDVLEKAEALLDWVKPNGTVSAQEYERLFLALSILAKRVDKFADSARTMSLPKLKTVAELQEESK